MSISFAQPQWFWLLLAAPLLGFAGWRFGVRGGRLPTAAFWLRLATFALLILTIAQPLLASGAGRSSTVFVVDRRPPTRSRLDAGGAGQRRLYRHRLGAGAGAGVAARRRAADRALVGRRGKRRPGARSGGASRGRRHSDRRRAAGRRRRRRSS